MRLHPIHMSHAAVKTVAAKDTLLLPVSMNTPESRCQQLLRRHKGWSSHSQHSCAQCQGFFQKNITQTRGGYLKQLVHVTHELLDVYSPSTFECLNICTYESRLSRPGALHLPNLRQH